MVAVLHSAFAIEKEVIKHHGQRGGPATKDSWGALPVSTADGVAAGWTADLCDEALRKELPQEEERKRTTLVKAAQERELVAWKEFDVQGGR